MSLLANYDLEIASDSEGAEIIDRIRPRQAAEQRIPCGRLADGARAVPGWLP